LPIARATSVSPATTAETGTRQASTTTAGPSWSRPSHQCIHLLVGGSSKQYQTINYLANINCILLSI
jgi:hypothetical protein